MRLPPAAEMWHTSDMIPLDEMRIGAKYWFDLGEYFAFGTFAERDADIIAVDEALIYMRANRNRFFFEERFLIDAVRLKNITVDEPDGSEDASSYFAGYDYGKLSKH